MRQCLGRLVLLEKIWSGRRDSNPRPQPWQGCALPLSYARRSRGGLLGRFPGKRKPALIPTCPDLCTTPAERGGPSGHHGPGGGIRQSLPRFTREDSRPDGCPRDEAAGGGQTRGWPYAEDAGVRHRPGYQALAAGFARSPANPIVRGYNGRPAAGAAQRTRGGGTPHGWPPRPRPAGKGLSRVQRWPRRSLPSTADEQIVPR